ncbi:MAG: PIG-L family deacetylase [Clostridia bacterium]|nr:PIG-L family deacetylase [Clostridia bacterium]
MKKRQTGLLLIVVFLFVSLFFAYSASALESTCPPAITAVATLARGETELNVYSDANKTEKVGKLKKGVTCQVVGIEGKYYRITFDGIDGYALKSKLSLKAAAGETAQTGGIVSDVQLDQYLFASTSQAKKMAIRGTIQADAPLDTLFFFLWDERQQEIEQILVKEVKEPTENLNIRDVCKNIEFSSMTAGRKTLVIQGASDGRIMEVFDAPVYVCGSFSHIRNINNQCKFSAGVKQKTGRSWTPSSSNKTLTITLPKDGSAKLMTIEWRFPVDSFTVVFLDADKKTISEETRTTGFYADAVEFPAGTQQVRLSLEGKDNWVRNLCVYDENHPDNAVQQWQPVPEKLDLMVFSPHQDDELLFFGGTIPYACQKGADVGVVYMTHGGRTRYTEALDGLWTAGLRNHPIFLSWRNQKVNSINTALKTWSQKGVDPQKEVVRLIRRYKPEVIVAPDPEGEYGHTQHKLTSRLVSQAIPLAMDETYDPESVQEYGTWEVKKVYLHLYKENRIEMDWDHPFSPDSPISPIFLAKEAYDKHRSQQKAYSMNREAVTYDNKIFGLYYTAVGPDEAKNDLFEHIDLH